MRTEAGADRDLGLGVLLAVLASVYATQTLLTTMAMQSLPALLREAGASLQFAGLSALFMLPWALRFLWAPAVERRRLPPARRPRRSRIIIVRGQWCLAATLGVAAGAGAVGWITLPQQAAWLLALFFLAALVSATVDIACGGFAVEQLRVPERGWGNAAKVGSAYLGVLLGSSVFLLLADWRGWPVALAVVALAIALLTLPWVAVREPARALPGTAHLRPSLRNAWHQSRVRLGLLLAFVLGAGVRVAVGMVGPMLLDHGVGMTELAWLFGAFSVGAGLLGCLLGGFMVRCLSGWPAALWMVFVQACVLGALVWSAAGALRPGLIVLVGLLFASMAGGFVAIYAALMGLASPSQPGVDFALFESADALMAMAGGVAGGWLAQHGGYTACFGLAAACSLVAVVFALLCVPRSAFSEVHAAHHRPGRTCKGAPTHDQGAGPRLVRQERNHAC